MKKRKVLGLVIGVFLIFSLSFLTSAVAEPIELKVSSWTPPQLPIAKLTEKWARMVEERSGHTVKLTFYWAGTLASYPDSYRVVQTGVADIGNYVFGMVSGLHTLNEFTSLPLLGWDDLFTATRVYHEMRRKFPQLDAEFKGLKPIYTSAMAPNNFHFTKKTVRGADDMKGLRIMAGGSWTDFLSAVGAVCVAKGPPDWYMSLQKGLVDGIFTHWPAFGGFGLEELCATHLEAGDAGFGLQMYGWYMNINSWNKIPKKAQQAFLDLEPWVEQEDLQLNARLIDQEHANAEKMGHPIYRLSPEQLAIWTNKVLPLHEKWIAEAEAKGLPGRAVYDEAKRLIVQYQE
jgi:TRAP-type C4-dicarboxylate transport system substrate-binding protein